MEQRILIVEPLEGIGKIVIYFLEDEGYQVTAVQSLEKAIQALRNLRFDLIITNALNQDHMGKGFNPTFLTELNSDAPSTPIILFSTWVSFYGIRPKQFSLTDVVGSCNINELVAKVNSLLRKDSPSTHIYN